MHRCFFSIAGALCGWPALVFAATAPVAPPGWVESGTTLGRLRKAAQRHGSERQGEGQFARAVRFDSSLAVDGLAARL